MKPIMTDLRTSLRTGLARVWGLFHRSPGEIELGEELGAHRAMLIDEAVRHGLSLAEAHRRASTALGNDLTIREKVRDQAGIPILESTAQDLRYAARTLRKSPALTVVIVISLALGIGANTAIFSLVNAVMLRSLPVKNPQELMTILRQARGGYTYGFSNPLWEAVRDQQDVFSGTFAYGPPMRFDAAQGGTVRDVNGLFLSGDAFTTLGIKPAAGRLFARDDDRRGCAPVAVLGYRFWQAQFGGAENALGSTILLNRQQFEIIGISPASFNGLEVGKNFDVAIPLCASALFDKANIESRSRWYLDIIGRVKPGITREQVQARLDVLAPSIMAAGMPEDEDAAGRQRMLKTKLLALPTSTGTSNLRDDFSGPLTILMLIVGLVLLIACANIASLLLSRATTRNREIAIRKALGASRGRLIRQLLTESVLLSMVGGALGVWLAKWASVVLVRSLSTGRNPIFLDLSTDRQVLGFTFLIAVVAGILLGLLPALRSTRVTLTEAMATRTATGGDNHSKFHIGKWIVAGQVALSLVLLIGGGLLLRTFLKLVTLDLGFDRGNVLTVIAKAPWFARDTIKLPPEERAAIYDDILQRLRLIPGVSSAARAYTTPMGDDNWLSDVYPDVPNAPTSEEATSYFNFVSPGYFATMRTPLLAGRDFNDHDTQTAAPVAIVNESLARKFYPGVNALGRHFRRGVYPEVREIVGIVKDSKYERVREVIHPTVFLPAAQAPPKSRAEEFVLRTSVPPSTVIPAVQKAVAEVNGALPLEFHTLAEQVDDNLVQERLLAALSGSLAGLALLLAMVGLYGLLSYLVAQRQVEFGIRMALGAQPPSILRLVMRDVALILGVGLAGGIVLSLATVRLLQKMLFGLQPRDTTTLATAVVALSAIALLAGYLPARRATRVDPMVALRYE